MKKLNKTKNQEPKESKELKEPKTPAEPDESGNQHRVINSLVGNLSNALEEDAGEIDEILEASSQGKGYHDREKRPMKYRFFLILGLLVFWQAIIGGIQTIRSISSFISDVSNQTSLKEELEQFIFPVVITDPPEFASTESPHSWTAIASGIWQIVLSGETVRFDRDRETGMVIIPESDVEAAVRGLFGSGFDIEHRSIDYIVFIFQYVPESKSYLVPENPNHFTFTPRIAEISSSGDTYKITVEYIALTPLLIAGIAHEIVPVKSMIYTITRTRDRSKTIQSIEFDREREIRL
jgi:hypothetical protein